MQDSSRRFITQFLARPGARKQTDIISYHPYASIPEETLDDIIKLREAVRKIKPGLPIWQGECGCPSSGDTIHTRYDPPWGYNVQSKWMLRRFFTDRIAGAEISTYLLNVEFRHYWNFWNPESKLAYNTKGLIQYGTWQPKPAYYTLQNLTAVVDHSAQTVSSRAEITITDPGSFYGIGPHEDRFPCVVYQYPMSKNGAPMLAYWLPWRPQEFVRPGTVRIKWPGITWSEPVWVDLFTGGVHEVTACNGGAEVPLADYPFILTEKKLLKISGEPQQPSYEEIISKLRWTFQS